MSEGGSSGVKCGENVQLEVLSFEEFIDIMNTQVPLSPVEALPDEILVKIFQMLPLVTRTTVLPKVCERWRIISRDFTVFPNTIDFNDFHPRLIWELMNKIYDTVRTNEYLPLRKLILPEIIEGDFYHKKKIAQMLVRGSDLGVWKSLTKLSAKEINIREKVFCKFISSLNSEIFTELSITKMTPNKMYSICGNLKNLQRLVVWNTVDKQSMQYLYAVISDLKLREMRIHVQSEVPVKLLEKILKACMKQLELLTLWLPYIYIIDRSFMKSLGLCRQLTYLDMWLPHEMKYDNLCRGLSIMTQLEQLNLRAPGLKGQRSSEHSLFTELHSLRHVYLCTDDVQNKDVTDLCKNCGHCLETIILEKCNELTDITVISTLIHHCNKLVGLKLDGCRNINKVELVEKLSNKPVHELPQIIVVNICESFWNSYYYTARTQLFINERTHSKSDETSVFSALREILGPNCYHRTRIIDKLISVQTGNGKAQDYLM